MPISNRLKRKKYFPRYGPCHLLTVLTYLLTYATHNREPYPIPWITPPLTYLLTYLPPHTTEGQLLYMDYAPPTHNREPYDTRTQYCTVQHHVPIDPYAEWIGCRVQL